MTQLDEPGPVATDGGFFRHAAADTSPLHPTLWDDLVSGGSSLHVPAGVTFRRAGDEPNIAAILNGTARVFAWTPSGRQATIRYVSAGDLVGVAALLRNSTMWGAEAVTEATVALVPAEWLRSLPTRRPDFGWAMAQELARIATESLCTSFGEGGQSMAVRVARHLLAIAVQGPDGKLVAPITHQRLADAVGTAREVATRALLQFRFQGLIETSPGRIVIVDADRLQSVAS